MIHFVFCRAESELLVRLAETDLAEMISKMIIPPPACPACHTTEVTGGQPRQANQSRRLPEIEYHHPQLTPLDTQFGITISTSITARLRRLWRIIISLEYSDNYRGFMHLI